MIHNVVIIGSGPAGHTAAIYLARANLSPLMLEGDSTGEIISGGLLTTTKVVENFPGFPEGIDGYDLTERFKEQSIKFGTKILSESVIKVEKYDDIFDVYTKTSIYKTKTIIVATGSTPKRLYIPGYDKFWHKGISTCAICDGGLSCYRSVPIAVAGGGDSACEEALHLAHTASKVFLIHRRDKLRASKIMQDRVFKNSKIEVIWNSEIEEIKGEKTIETLILKNVFHNTISDLSVRGLFVALGHTPNSEFISNIVNTDTNGYIKTNEKKETSQKGIWAVGDVQDPHYRQAITAAASGCIAALEVERWLN